MNDQLIESKLKALVLLLVNRDFDIAANLLLDKCASSQNIKTAIENYEFGDGQDRLRLTMPPPEAFTKKNFYPQTVKFVESAKATGLLEFDLWFDNQPSDLTLICGVVEANDGNIDLLISDIRMM